MNAILEPLSLPPFSAITPASIEVALDAALTEYQAATDQVVDRRALGFDDIWMPVERAKNAVDALWSAVSHLKSVADNPELRAAHDMARARIVEATTRALQNRAYFDLLTAMAKTPGFATLDLADRVAIERRLRDCRLAGVALDTDARARFADISVELSQLSTAFGSAVVDATDAWSKQITDESELAGLPDAAKAMFRAAASAKGLDGWLITLQMPSVDAVLTFAENRDLRQTLYTAFGTRASDQGPHAGEYDNGPRMARILELRREAAGLLGFSDPVAWSLATKMAADSGEILAFLRDLAARARPSAERDLAEMRAFAASDLGIDDMQPWDMGFVGNRLRAARYAVDEQAVRRFFPVEKVIEGWQALLHRLFGIRLRARDDVDLWHTDATFYDVVGEDGLVFAGLYIDLHARAGKKGGAWMAEARPRLRSGNIVSHPVAYLTCNFAPRGGGDPSLLSHGDVQTLLHETGHCLHLLFTRVNRPSVAGVNGFEWDAVELPSQLMEDFAWDRDILTSMSGHLDTGEPLPAELFAAMLAARNFQSGLAVLRQIEFAMFDLILHLGTLGSDPMAVIGAVRDEIAVIRPPAWHRFPHAFAHIFAGGYAAGYYSYLWAEVLSADGFGKFVEAGLVDRATGDALREEILSRGATRSAAESFRAFRGRAPDNAAMLARRGLA
ncbi:M3 family metallopeptidase [Sphingopyxis sp.]|uniref:M3 family metallopeptidase n=1 Tax=Sphingopyxis sp. TaxID=1908224 RepID=UPI00260806D8|nr:M3 family metallopeptidase [Sphingopyxis sp.]MCW0199444.1 M3 family metallopeptidase [Sphingopyxis sp.]